MDRHGTPALGASAGDTSRGRCRRRAWAWRGCWGRFGHGGRRCRGSLRFRDLDDMLNLGLHWFPRGRRGHRDRLLPASRETRPACGAVYLMVLGKGCQFATAEGAGLWVLSSGLWGGDGDGHRGSGRYLVMGRSRFRRGFWLLLLLDELVVRPFGLDHDLIGREACPAGGAEDLLGPRMDGEGASAGCAASSLGTSRGIDGLGRRRGLGDGLQLVNALAVGPIQRKDDQPWKDRRQQVAEP